MAGRPCKHAVWLARVLAAAALRVGPARGSRAFALGPLAPALALGPLALVLTLGPLALALAFGPVPAMAQVAPQAASQALPRPPSEAAAPPAVRASPPLAIDSSLPVTATVAAVEQAGSTRLEFDWPIEVGWSVSAGGTRTTLTFSRSAWIDTRPVQGRVFRTIRNLHQIEGQPRAVIGFDIPRGSQVRWGRTERGMFVEVTDPPSADSVFATSEAPPQQPGHKPPAPPAPAQESAGAASGPDAAGPGVGGPGTAGSGSPAPPPALPAPSAAAAPGRPSAPPAAAAAQAGSVATGPVASGSVATGPVASGSVATGPVASGPTVKVRVGEHADRTRLVFDWTRQVGYNVQRRGDQVTLGFNAPARADLSQVTRRPLRHVSAIAEEPAAAPGLSVAMRIPSTARVTPGTDGSKVYVDIYGPGTYQPTAAEQGPAPAPRSAGEPAPASGSAAASSAAAGGRPPAGPFVPPSAAMAALPTPAAAAPASPPAALPPPAAAVPPPGSAREPALPAPTPLGPASTAGKPPPGSGRLPALPVSSPTPSAPGSTGGPAGMDAATPGGVPTGVPNGAPTGAPAGMGAATPSAAAAAAAVMAAAAPSRPKSPEATTAALVFNPGVPTAAAVFVRGGHLSVVFDRPVPATAGRIVDDRDGIFGAIEPVASRNGGAFRTPLRKVMIPIVTRTGTEWRIGFKDGTPGRMTVPRIVVDPVHPLGARALVRTEDAGIVVELADPAVGDTLAVVPLPAPGVGIPDERRFAQFDILPASQGIVVRKTADELVVRPVREGIEVGAMGGLRVSPSDDINRVPAPPPERSSAGDSRSAALSAGTPASDQGGVLGDRRLFELKEWQAGPLRDYNDNLQKLQLAVATAADPADRTQGRLALARFLFSHGMLAEARGVLKVLGGSDPDLLDQPEVRALRAGIAIADNRLDEGERLLNGGGLEGNREAALWRAYAAAKRRDWPKAIDGFIAGDELLSEYPEPYFRRLTAAAAEANLRQRDPHAALWLADRYVQQSGRPAASTPMIGYLRGEALRQLGEYDQAMKQLRIAAESNDRYYRSHAGYSLVNLELANGRISHEQAAERLNLMRAAWRDDDFDLDVVQRHGEVLWDGGRHADGLMALREAAAFHPDSPRAAAITRMMADRFQELYQDGASQLPPVQAVSLYNQFRELTPTDSRGDEIVRQLAERLIEIDLLGHAGDLLQHQLDYRIKGPQRLELGKRLAVIRLLDGQPDAALKALDASEGTEMAPELAAERRLLRARGLAQLERRAEALTVIAKDNSRPANMLRVSVAWREHDWRAAADALSRLIGPPPGGTMDGPTAQLVLNRAVAMALAGDGDGLEGLRRDFGSAMSGTAEADAFRVLTRPDQIAGLYDLRTIRSRLAEVDLFQSFLNHYRSARNGPQSAAAPGPPS